MTPVSKEKSTDTATFGGGCFWGVEETFRTLPGVLSTAVGFMGGTAEDPSYERVCMGDTNHAEVVQVTYDPETIPYDTLLETFWTSHNPTLVNRQGPDIGTQYRSVIFTHNDEQRVAAEESKKQLEESGLWKDLIATEILPAGTFYKAEEYHQQYLMKRGLGSCHI